MKTNDDGLNAVRGILNGLLISVALAGVVFVALAFFTWGH